MVNFVVAVDHRVKMKEREKEKKILRSCRRAEKKTVKHERDDDATNTRRPWTVPKSL